MATYNASDLTSKPLVGSLENASVYFGNVTPGVNTATADLLRPCKLPAGFMICALILNVRTAFATTAPAKIGFSHVDGSTPSLASPDVSIAPITDTSHATTGVKVVCPAVGPILLQKDSYLEVVFGTIATAASGVADYTVLGETRGSM